MDLSARVTSSILLACASGACSADPSHGDSADQATCDAVAAHVHACTGEEIDPSSGCPAGAGAVLDLSCDDLLARASDTKADCEDAFWPGWCRFWSGEETGEGDPPAEYAVTLQFDAREHLNGSVRMSLHRTDSGDTGSPEGEIAEEDVAIDSEGFATRTFELTAGRYVLMCRDDEGQLSFYSSDETGVLAFTVDGDTRFSVPVWRPSSR